MEITIKVRENQAGRVEIDCVPNFHLIPDGKVRRTVRQMLDNVNVFAADGNWTQTVDNRRPLRLATESGA